MTNIRMIPPDCLTRQARVKVSVALIQGVTTDRSGGAATNGDGIEIRGGTFDGQLLSLSDVDGVGLLATAEAKVKLLDVRCLRPAIACLLAEQRSSVSASVVQAQGAGEAAFAVPDQATLELEKATVSPASAPWFYAECSAGAQVGLLLTPGQPVPERLSSCVTMRPARAPR